MCRLLFGVCSTPVLPQWHVKDPGHSAKSAGGRLRVNKQTPLTQQSWSGLTMLLSRHSVGTYLEMSSNATCQGTCGHSCHSSLSHCRLILAYRMELVCASYSLQKKKRKKAQARYEWWNIVPKSPQVRKKPPPGLCLVRIACLEERQIHDLKVASLNPGRSGRRIFFSRVNFLC